MLLDQPTDIICEIVSFLSLEDLINIRLVCKYFSNNIYVIKHGRYSRCDINHKLKDIFIDKNNYTIKKLCSKKKNALNTQKPSLFKEFNILKNISSLVRDKKYVKLMPIFDPISVIIMHIINMKVEYLIIDKNDGMNLLDYINFNYQQLKLIEWRRIFLQILFSLLRIQFFYPLFQHNNMSPKNILINLEDKYDENYSAVKDFVKFNNGIVAFVPKNNMNIKIINLEFASIDDKNKVNKYYDVQFLFDKFKNKDMFPCYDNFPDEIKNFIDRIVSNNENDNGYVSVDDIITQDPLFMEFRC